FLQATLQRALKFLPDFPEWGSRKTIETYHWPTFRKALHTLHTPQKEEDFSGTAVARQRLAYDEFLAQQMSLLLNRKQRDKNEDLAFTPAPDLLDKFLNTLPFQLTSDQQQVLKEVEADLSSPAQMRRLIQGDVGSGKTVVAFCSALPILAQKGQVAFLAPTEILARQHFETIGKWAQSLGLNTALLIGGLTAAKKRTLKKEIQSGVVSVVVGTHALLQDTVSFQNLGLVVIDEQHRFGVTQRLQLAEKGKSSNMLAMSATPIPRTLVLAAYGDLDISTLREKPAGRQPIDTRLISTDRLGDVVTGLQRALSQGQKAYWICPLVEESEVLDLAAAEERYEDLKKIFGEDVGVLHGRMKPSEKEAAMAEFTSGKTKLLVATTVVEVGVDVKDATIIIIEHAERFGLAQLHQLRGRVGRGDQPSTCLLLFSHALTPKGQERLKVLRESTDGFYIAEADLKIRGGGDILGLRQSGFPDFRLGELPGHLPLLHQARKDAEDLLKEDPTLSSVQGHAIQSLLLLFGYTDAAQNLKAG
ncbi:MAG: ATP-dependent DNA helicase RecG, partial [bacterium]|nr:ATP-dependent DNA helicase RecG [bacterium]